MTVEESRSELDRKLLLNEMLLALKLARQYVKATHGVVAGAVGEDNLVSPDLEFIDAAIARAELLSDA